MSKKMQIVCNSKGQIIATGPTTLKKSREGPNGLAFECLDDQEIHEFELPKNASKLSMPEIYTSFRIHRISEAKLVDVRPKRKKR